MTQIFLGSPSNKVQLWMKTHAQPVQPVAPDGKVLYRTSANGEWIEAPAVIYNGAFLGVDPNNDSQPPSNIVSRNSYRVSFKDSFSDYCSDSCCDDQYFYYDTCSDSWDGIRYSVYEIILPSKDAHGNKVMHIGAWAFYGCDHLTSVTIPDGVTDIGTEAFQSCIRLTSITIPKSVTRIDYKVFDNCNSITNVTFLGKTMEQVQNITDLWNNKYYPWGLDLKYGYDQPIIHYVTIHCMNGDINIQVVDGCSDSCGDSCSDWCSDSCW